MRVVAAFRAGVVALALAALLAACSAPAASVSGSEACTSGAASAVKSPEVGADGSATLRLAARGAIMVTARGDFGEVALTKGACGVWSATTSPLEPGIYSYFFSVDGATLADPGNPDIKGASESLLTIPGDPPRPGRSRTFPAAPSPASPTTPRCSARRARTSSTPRRATRTDTDAAARAVPPSRIHGQRGVVAANRQGRGDRRQPARPGADRSHDHRDALRPDARPTRRRTRPSARGSARSSRPNC